MEIWDATNGRHPIDAALETLEIAGSGLATTGLLNAPLGARDAALLSLRAQLLGDVIEATGVCPACATVVESQLSCADLIAADRPAPGSWLVDSNGYVVELRSLTSADARDAAAAGSSDAARTILLQRAVHRAESDSAAVPVEALPPRVARAIARSLAEHDPAAEFLLQLTCPACGHHWTDVLDTAPFVISELRMAAQQLLHEVDLLARSYSWPEAAILALSPARRAAYAALALG